VLDYLPQKSPVGTLKLIGQRRADPREDKIGPGAGVYRDAAGTGAGL